jgi:glycosyltransferase involved in cell wall biosynthesis
MKIALLIDSLVAAGAQRQMVVLANGLAQLGYEVELFYYREKLQLLDDLESGVVKLTLIRKLAKVDPSFVIRLTQALRKTAPDVLISFLAGPNFWGRIAGRFARVHAIVTSERNTEFGNSSLMVTLERVMSRLSSHIVVNTHTAKDILLASVGVPATKVRVIYNGVDTARFAPRADKECLRRRSRLGIGSEETVLVLPGRISTQKNHECLIRALPLLGSALHTLRVLFVGNVLESDLKARLVSILHQLNLSDRTVFCGFDADMPGVYGMADLVVLPSRWEGLPNVVLEAMSCQTPVIISDISDNRKIVSDGETGFLFADNDPADLARQITRFLGLSPNRKSEIGIAAREAILRNFSLANFVSNFATLIEDCRT